MLSVILIWLYIGITTYTLGYGALKLLTSISFMCDYKGSKPTPYKIRYQENYIVAGLIITTVYAQVFSLFSGVGLIANVILVLICLSVIFVFREELFLRIRSLFRVLNSTHSMYLYVLVFLLMAFGTSEGLMHYDTGLYHAQAIHWIEDYGVVKGLGNLHVRLAYNSSAFPLTALYSFSFLGQSFHVTAGFFALLLAWQCIDLKDIARRKHPVVPDFARLLAIYYLFNIFDEMVSPASDYYVTCLIFYIIIHWLDLNVSKEESFVPYAFLSMAIVYAITLKLSAVPFIIMMIKPISMLRVRDKSIIKKMEKKERQKNVAGKNRFQKTEKFTLPKKRSLKAFFLCFIICIMIAVPFVIRNAIISGWLIYPFTGLDLLNVSWKIPKGVAEYDAREIAVYGRGYTDVTQYDIPISQWLPGWISGLGLFNKVMLIGDIISFVIFVIWGTTLAILNKISSGKKDKSKLMVQNNIFKLSRTRRLGMVDFMLVEFTCFAALTFWFLNAPLVRYGAMYIWLPVTLMAGKIFMAIFNRLPQRAENKTYLVIIVMSLIFIAVKGVRLISMEIPGYDLKYLLVQEDYDSFETESYEVNGITFYYPVEGDRAGYDPFPSSPVQGNFIMRGNSLSDGFGALQSDTAAINK